MALKAQSIDEEQSSQSMKYPRPRGVSNPAEANGANDDGALAVVLGEITSIRDELNEVALHFGAENGTAFILPDIEEDSDGEYDSDDEDDSMTHESCSSRMSQTFVQFAPSIPMEATSKYRQPGMPVLQELEGSFAELGFHSVHVENKPDLVACVNSVNVDAQRDSPTMDNDPPPHSVAVVQPPKRMHFTSILPGLMGGTTKLGASDNEEHSDSQAQPPTLNTASRRTRSLSMSKSRENSASPTPMAALNEGEQYMGEEPCYIQPTAANLAALSANFDPDPNRPPSIRSETSVSESVQSMKSSNRDKRKMSINKLLRPNQVQPAFEQEPLLVDSSMGAESHHSECSYQSRAHQSIESGSAVSYSSQTMGLVYSTSMPLGRSGRQRSDSEASSTCAQTRHPASRAQPPELAAKPRKARLSRILLSNHVQADFVLDQEIKKSERTGSHHGTPTNGRPPTGIMIHHHGEVQALEVELELHGEDESVPSSHSSRGGQPPRAPPRGPARPVGPPGVGPPYPHGMPPYPQYQPAMPPHQYPQQHFPPGGPPQSYPHGAPHQQHGPPLQYPAQHQYPPQRGPPSQYPPQQYPPGNAPPSPQSYHHQGAPQQYPPQSYHPQGPTLPYHPSPYLYPPQQYPQGGHPMSYAPGPGMPPPSSNNHYQPTLSQHPPAHMPMTPYPNPNIDKDLEPASPLTPQTPNEEYPPQSYQQQQQPYPQVGSYQQPYQQGPPVPHQQQYRQGPPPPHYYSPGGPQQHYAQGGPQPQIQLKVVPPHQYHPAGAPQTFQGGSPNGFQSAPAPQHYSNVRAPPLPHRMSREPSTNSNHSTNITVPTDQSDFAGDAQVTVVTDYVPPQEKKKGLMGLFGGKKLTAEEKREAQRMKYADYDL